MRHILVLESAGSERPPDYDHVVSFSTAGGDSYPHQYVSPAEVDALEDDVFNRFLSFLEKQIDHSLWEYRGVELVRCFKKKFFNLLSFTSARLLVLSRIVEHFSASDIDIEDFSDNWEAPYLSTLLKMRAEIGAKVFHFRKPLRSSVLTGKLSRKGADRWLAEVWPHEVHWGNWRRARIGLFSDPKKANAVIEATGARNCVFYTNVKSPRSWLSAVEKGFAFYQAARQKQHPQAGDFLNRISQSNPFEGFHYSDFPYGVLLWRRARELFERELSSLLSQIDSMHSLFSSGSSMRSVLLDEDIAPAKNSFCQVAKQHQVTSYVACHGSLGKKSSYLPLTADRLFVWGKAQREKLIQWGLSENRIVVSGCGRYSSYLKMDSQGARQKVAAQLGIDPKRKIVVIAFMISAPHRRRLFDAQQKEFLEDVLGLIKEYPEVQFVIKSKNTTDANYRFCLEWLKKHDLSQCAVLVQDIDSLLLIKSADLAIVHNTTFGIEALALRCPIISYYDQFCSLWEEYKPYDAFLMANSRDALRSLFASLAKDNFRINSSRFEKARQECLNQDGAKPEEVIASVLLDVKAMEERAAK